jgi:hypothetical protein
MRSNNDNPLNSFEMKKRHVKTILLVIAGVIVVSIILGFFLIYVVGADITSIILTLMSIFIGIIGIFVPIIIWSISTDKIQDPNADAAPISLLEKIMEKLKNKIVLAAIGLLLLIGPVYVWDYNRLKTEYYADYVDRWGLAEGVVPLSKSQVSKRYAHYRFESKQRKLRRVVYANSAGIPIGHLHTEYIDRASIQEFTYTDDGRLQTTYLKSANEKTIVSYVWGGANWDVVDLKDRERESAVKLASSFTSISSNLFSGETNSSKADIKRFKLTRNEEGY